MESKVKLFGHPIHRMLIVFPLGLFATAVIFDLLYLLRGTIEFALVAYWMIAAGILGDWSPDGCQIVVTTPGESVIFVMNADGSNYREIAHGEFPKWMANGQEIRFRQDTHIHLIRADGTEEQVLSHEPLYGTVSPNGKLVAYEIQHEHSLLIYDVQSGASTKIGRGWAADWSPDSQRLI